MKKWRSSWTLQTQCRQTKLWSALPDHDISKALLETNRKVLSYLIQIISGHGFLNYHQHLAGKSSTDLCRFCHTTSETTWHIINLCPHFNSARSSVFANNGFTNDVPNFVTAQDFIRLSDFLTEVNIDSLFSPEPID